MQRTTTLRSLLLAALPIALLAAVAAIVVPDVRADLTDPHANVALINIVGVRDGKTAPFYVTGEPFGNAVWQPLGQPVIGNTFATIPGTPTFGGAKCQPEYSRARIVTPDGSSVLADLVAYRCAQPSGASTTNGLYDIVSGTGRFANFTAGGGIFSIDERADGQAFLALSGMHCRPRCVSSS